jgi:hypothetical protein
VRNSVMVLLFVASYIALMGKRSDEIEYFTTNDTTTTTPSTPLYPPKEGVIVSTPTFNAYNSSTTQSLPPQVPDKLTEAITPIVTPQSETTGFSFASLKSFKSFNMDSMKLWVEQTFGSINYWIVFAIVIVWCIMLAFVVVYEMSRGNNMVSNTRMMNTNRY